ncbi:AtMMH-1 [Cristinia sonorae]|uniref:AtMMH-1 n=1 Tax=Cristinia sonorae TaxID=1940300 RepID=A0A8K0UI33_9AGAR|nr:AtMMH-1 [Cristinia sonorae]
MPELPEVERAKELVKRLAKGKTIARVDTSEDSIVFAGIPHTEFAKELQGRKVKDVARYGKVFYLVLDGPGRMPILHFGMTGMIQVKGERPVHYREAPRKISDDWPPKFMKFVLHIRGDDTSDEDIVQLAFMDARRLGRIRLCQDPLTEPPISTLGFDPILSMPSLDDFRSSVLKRTCPIKALLLDQSFSAGVGNWVADEILYHSRIHPERRCNTLQPGEVAALHQQTQDICNTAVAVNADDSKFPENWLFKHRWGKGKKQKSTLKLPNGEPATLKWVTVSGRTSAFVAELQRLSSTSTETLATEDSDSDLTPLEDEDAPAVVVTTRAKRTRDKVDTEITEKLKKRRMVTKKR